MALRHWIRVKSVSEVSWDIKIHDSDFTGTVPTGPTLRSGDKNGFVLDYKKSKKKLETIKASSLTFGISVQDATEEAFIDELMQAIEGRFTCELSKNGSRYWTGVLVSDIMSIKEQAIPFVAQIKAVDGLSLLKNIPYVAESQIFTISGLNDFEKIGVVINKCMRKLVTTDLFWSGTSDWLLRWHVGLYASGTTNDDGTSQTYSLNNFAETHLIRQKAFYETLSVGEYKIMSCYEVIKRVLSSFGLRIFQSAGEWRIVQVSLYANDYLRHGVVMHSESDDNFAVSDSHSYNVLSKKDLGVDYKRRSKRTIKYMPAYDKVSVKYKGIEVTNWIADFVAPNAIWQSLGNVSDGTVDGHKIRFNTDVNWSYSGALSTFSITFKVGIKIVGTSGTVWYLKHEVGTPPVWTNNANDKVQVTYPNWGINNYYGASGGTTSENSTASLSTVSPAIPESGEIFINWSMPTTTPGWGNFPTASGFSFSWEDPYMAFMPFGTDSGSSDLYKAINDDSGFSLTDSLPTMLFGDGPAPSSNGAIHFGSTPTTTWRSDANGDYVDDGYSHPLARLMVREYLAMNKRPTKLIQGKIFGDLDFYHKLVEDGDNFVCLGAKLIGKLDEWSGEWFELRRDGLSVGVVDFDEDNEPETNDDPTISVPPKFNIEDTPEIFPEDSDVISNTTEIITGTKTSINITSPSANGIAKTYYEGDTLTILMPDNTKPVDLVLTADLRPGSTTIQFESYNFTDTYPGDSKIKLTQISSYDNLKGDYSNAVLETVINKETTTITAGTPVYIVDPASSGDVVGVKIAKANDKQKMPASFVVSKDILTTSEGFAAAIGRVKAVDTSGATIGDDVYVAPTGGFTTTKPSAPNEVQRIGTIAKVDASDGEIAVNINQEVALPTLAENQIFLGDSNSNTVAVDSDSVLVKTVKKTLTVSEYQNLDTTPIDILAAPGAGKVIIPIAVRVVADHTATETRREIMYFGHDTAITSGDFYASIRDFMYNKGGDYMYAARVITDTIHRGTGENKPFKVHASGSYNGNLDVSIFLTYQILTI